MRSEGTPVSYRIIIYPRIVPMEHDESATCSVRNISWVAYFNKEFPGR